MNTRNYGRTSSFVLLTSIAIVGGLVWLYLALPVVIDSVKQIRNANAPRLKKRQRILGDVFIVTKGGQSLKLGLIEVRAIAKETILKYLEERKAIATQEQEKLTPSRDAASERRIRARDEWKKQLDVTRRSGYAEEVSLSLELARLKTLRATVKLKEETEAEEDRLRNAFNYWSSGEFYFSSLPQGIASTKTDADGKFELEVSETEFALAAQGHRLVGDKTEDYYWLVWPPEDSSKRFFLSNDSLTSTNFADSLIAPNPAPTTR